MSAARRHGRTPDGYCGMRRTWPGKIRLGFVIWLRFASNRRGHWFASPYCPKAIPDRVSPDATVYWAKPWYGSIRARPKVIGTTTLFNSSPSPDADDSKTSRVPWGVDG